jgi:hypothetical protein
MTVGRPKPLNSVDPVCARTASSGARYPGINVNYLPRAYVELGGQLKLPMVCWT